MARKPFAPAPPPGVADFQDPVHAAFVADMVAAPADDTPRLVFADWLDDQGHPEYAEFIRVQCELVRSSTPMMRVRELRLRERKLLEANAEAWLGPEVSLRQVEFHRGFLCQVSFHSTLSGKRALELAQKPAFSLLMLSERWDWQDRHSPVELLVRLPGLAAQRDPFWRRHALRNLGEVLLASPYLEGITDLELCDRGLPDEALVALASNPALARLVRLDLGTGRSVAWRECQPNRFGRQGMAALASSPYLDRLERLRLDGSTLFDDEGVSGLLDEPRLPRLRVLNLRETAVSNYGVMLLAMSPWVEQLEELTLGMRHQVHNALGDSAAEALAESPYLANLRFLHVVLGDTSRPVLTRLRRRFGQRLRIN